MDGWMDGWMDGGWMNKQVRLQLAVWVLYLELDRRSFSVNMQKVSEYDQEMPQSHTTDQPMAPQGREQ